MALLLSTGDSFVGFDSGSPRRGLGQSLDIQSGRFRFGLSGDSGETAIRADYRGQNVQDISFDLLIDGLAQLTPATEHALVHTWDDNYQNFLELRFRTVDSGKAIQFLVYDLTGGAYTQILVAPEHFKKGTMINVGMQLTAADLNVRVNGVLVGTKRNHGYTKKFGVSAFGAFYANAVSGDMFIDNVKVDVITAPAPAVGEVEQEKAVYEQFMQNYLRTDGKIVRPFPDGANGDFNPWTDWVSEASAGGALMAVRHGHKERFDSIVNAAWNKLRRTFWGQTTYLNLMTWHYDIENDIPYDYAPANDADFELMKAYYLAHEAWGSSGVINYLSRANLIADDLKASARTLPNGKKIIGSGSADTNETIEINVSYYDLMAFEYAKKYHGSNAAFWEDIIVGSLYLMQLGNEHIYAGQTSTAHIAPDWYNLNTTTGVVTDGMPYRSNPGKYGYEAFRTPFRVFEWALYFDQHTRSKAVYDAAATYFNSLWTNSGYIPAELNHDGTIFSGYDAFIFTYAAYFSSLIGDQYSGIAGAIKQYRLDLMYTVTPEGHIFRKNNGVDEFSYYDQLWLIQFEQLRLRQAVVAIDTFDSTLINTGLWNITGDYRIIENALTMNSAKTADIVGLKSAIRYNHKEATSSVRLRGANPNGANGVAFYPLTLQSNDGNTLGFRIVGGVIQAFYQYGNGARTFFGSAEYEPTTHQFLRIIEKQGNVFLSTSQNGKTWSLLGSNFTPFGMQSVQYQFLTTTTTNNSARSIMSIDNVNSPTVINVDVGVLITGDSDLESDSNIGVSGDTLFDGGSTVEANGVITRYLESTYEAGAEIEAEDASQKTTGRVGYLGDSEMEADGVHTSVNRADFESDSEMVADGVVTQAGATNYTADSELESTSTVIYQPIEKQTQYKVFTKDLQYITTFSPLEIGSEFNFKRQINTAGSEVTVKLNRLADEYGENSEVKHGNIIQISVADGDAPNGVSMFWGSITKYKPDYVNESVELTLLGLGYHASQTIIEDPTETDENGTPSTLVPFYSVDPADIFRTAIDRMAAQGVKLQYTNTSIEDTDTTVTYIFNTATGQEMFDKGIELCPAEWYWYVDQSTCPSTVHLHKRHESPDHTFVIGHDITSLSIENSMEPIANVIYFTGGGSPVMYLKKKLDSSIAKYGVKALRVSDGRVTQKTTALIIINRLLVGSPEILVNVGIGDNGLERQKGYDIETPQIGQMVQIANTGTSASSFYDSAKFDESPFDYDLENIGTISFQLTEISYSLSELTASLSTTPPDVAKRISDIKRNVDDQIYSQNPSVPEEDMA